MGQTRAPVLIETLVTEPAVVRFDVEVLVRLARLDQAHRAAGYMRPGSDNDDFAKSVWGTQYLSIRDTERLTRAGIEPSVGSRDDAYDQRPRRDGDRGISPARFMNAPGQTVKVRRHSTRSILPTIRRCPCGFMNNAGEDRGDSVTRTRGGAWRLRSSRCWHGSIDSTRDTSLNRSGVRAAGGVRRPLLSAGRGGLSHIMCSLRSPARFKGRQRARKDPRYKCSIQRGGSEQI